MKKLKTKEFWVSLIVCLIGVLGIALMVKHVVEWTSRGPVWENDPNIKYLTNEIVSRWTNLLYFTNLTLFVFCIYAILNFISVLFDIQKLKNFLKNPYVLMFIAINQFLVLFVFTSMVAAFGFQVTAEELKAPGNMHNFAASLFKHYFLTIVSIVFVFLQKPRQKISFKKCLWFLAYPIGYAIIVKIIGMTCFPFEWYPYPFFGVKHMWFNLFGNFENYNFTYAFLLVVGCIILIAGIYILLTYLFSLIYNKLVSKEENKKTQNAT